MVLSFDDEGAEGSDIDLDLDLEDLILEQEKRHPEMVKTLKL
jgi:hypothetical protein